MIRKNTLISLLCLAAASLMVSCAGWGRKPDTIPESEISNDFMAKIYDQRSWAPPGQLPFDPIGFGKRVDIPVNSARTKLIGPSYEEALDSLAAKIWMIENAAHTVDVAYYIFKTDTVGYAMLGALCNAVKRGVDVRIMVDSIGSIHPSHNALRGLETCTANAGFVRDEYGQPTDKKARAQVVLINALTKLSSKKNRRAHDKLLLVDGHVPERAIAMTGGRNISVSYYGIHDDGTPDPTAYQDLEIVLRPDLGNRDAGNDVGSVTTYYYTMLFLHSGNRRLRPLEGGTPGAYGSGPSRADPYRVERERAQEKLAFVKRLPGVSASLEKMPVFLSSDYRKSWVRLAHELGNLRNPKAVTEVEENLRRNPNSIQSLAFEIHEAQPPKTMRIVSPYFFVARYVDKDGNEIYDGVKEIYKWLNEDPERSVELVTNSVITSDNFIAQAIIDMDTAPRTLLPPDLLKHWLSGLEKGEFDPGLVESDAWKKAIMHPRIKIYQTGKLDSVILGGKTHYGKLHAKFLIADGYGFVGTTNFDYRSRLFNNEMGYYFKGDDLYDDLIGVFEELKAKSYRWGTPEWLEMRKTLISGKGRKASTTRKQRGLFKTARATGLEWLF
jgi:phosphatidylserine/phosphatidylglycerophosphate/cardiolipin synthase-like enzyme